MRNVLRTTASELIDMSTAASQGGYKPRDFVRVSLPLTVVMLAVTLVMVNVAFKH